MHFLRTKKISVNHLEENRSECIETMYIQIILFSHLGELLQSWPGPHWSGRYWRTMGFPEAVKHQGHGETRQELTALVAEADEVSVLPGQQRGTPHL